MKKHTVAIILALTLLLILPSCGKNNIQDNSIPSASSSESASSTDNSVDTEKPPVDTSQESDIERTYFTVDFSGEAVGNPMNISLVLPEDWTSTPSGIFDNQDNWVASVDLHKKRTDGAFVDIDEQYINVALTKDITVSNYPVKLYVLGFKKSGNGEMEAGTQYLYYIMVDDAYVLVFFSPKDTNDIDEKKFDEIISSFEVIAG